MTEQATKSRHGLLAGNLVAGVTLSLDGFAGASELGGRSVCLRIDAVEPVDAPWEPKARGRGQEDEASG
jgi:hypothetical protein